MMEQLGRFLSQIDGHVRSAISTKGDSENDSIGRSVGEVKRHLNRAEIEMRKGFPLQKFDRTDIVSQRLKRGV